MIIKNYNCEIASWNFDSIEPIMNTIISLCCYFYLLFFLTDDGMLQITNIFNQSIM